MATIQFVREHFACFAGRNAREIRQAVKANILPHLQRVSSELAPALSAMTGRNFQVLVTVRGRKDKPIQEAIVAFGAPDKDYSTVPHFIFGVSRAGVHARVALPVGAAAERTLFAAAIERDIASLARRFGSLSGLRSHAGAAGAGAWANGGLPPEVVPNESFWASLVEPLRSCSGELDVGFGWPASRARALALIEILTAFERLAPLYRLMDGGR